MGLIRAALRADARPELAALSTAQALTALGSTDPERRRQGALALRGEPAAAEALGDALLREDHLAAREALLLALRSADSASLARVGEALLRRGDVTHRVTGVELLAAAPAASAGTLASLLGDADPDVRSLAATAIALGEVPLERALLGALTHDPDAGVRCALLDALRVVGGEDTARALGARYADGADDLESYAANEARAAADRRSRQ